MTQAERTTTPLNNLPTYLLVHGAWHGGWCWQQVEKSLAVSGAVAHAITLTGLAEWQHLKKPTPNLTTHVDDVIRIIESYDLTDFILVGHSYGGMVITAVADRMKDRIRHIVYLDAALPEDDQNMLSQNPDSSPESVEHDIAELKQLAPDGIWIPPFPASVFGIPPEQEPLIAWVDQRLTAHPLPTWTEPIKLKNGGSEGLPRTYIHCVEPILPRSSFPAHALRIQRGDAGADWRYREIKTGHDAMITAPEAVARELLMTVDQKRV